MTWRLRLFVRLVGTWAWLVGRVLGIGVDSELVRQVKNAKDKAPQPRRRSF